MPEGYEHRPEQLRMADATARTLERGGVLLVEAGTGTGKTLAYLTASVAAERPVIVSTGTKNLQDQIVKKDIPLLEAALGRPIGAVCLKGLGNYLCLRKLEAARRAAPLLDLDEAALLGRIASWADETETGDRAELEDLPEDLPLWRELAADAESRLGPRCPYNELCFVTRARREAEEAAVVVVNHHLFFADLALRESAAKVLPDYDCVVFDEAHQIEGVATEFFGLRVSGRQIELLAHDSRRAAAALECEGVPGASSLPPLADHVTAGARGFFDALRRALGAGSAGDGRCELPVEVVTGEVEAAYWRLDAALEALGDGLSALPTADERASGCARRAATIRADLSAILGPASRRASVHWAELGKAGAVGSSPIDVAELLRERIFFQVEAVVLTSATLTAAGSFAYVRDRLGVDFDAAELVLPSPFDFRRQAALWLPDDAPDPRAEGYAEALARLIAEGCGLVRGGVLALFTSWRVLTDVATRLRGAAGLGRAVRVQGERPRSALLAELRGGVEPLLLLATASFWEGVDVPGEALELVVITRLPFASPGDPVVAARLRALAEAGRSPFADYQVPQAALTLKQGFGRLIRTRRDRGVVAILDRRLQTMGYGQSFLKTLPRCTVVRSLDEARGWQTLGVATDQS